MKTAMMVPTLHALLRLLAVSVALARAQALVAGTPQPPITGPPPRWWIESGNDLFGIREGGAPVDDFRTAEVSAAACPGDHVAIAIDDSLLTDRARGTRTDEVTATVGVRANAVAGARGNAWVAMGGGARRVGDLGGQRVQDALHAVVNNPRYRLTYDHDGTSPFAYALIDSWYQATSTWGCDGSCCVAATSAGQVESEVAMHIDGGAIIGLHRATAWVGARWRGRDGSEPTATSAVVAAYERGVRIDYGVAYSALCVTGDWDPWRRRSYGAIAVIIRR